MRPLIRAAAAALALTALSAGLVGCGEQDDDDTGVNPSVTVATASADASLASQVPAAIKADGKILVGSDASYAPSEFFKADGKTIQGFDVDLFTAIAQKLGLKAEFENADFDAILPGIGSGKYEVGVSSFTINNKRKGQVDMISYFSAGTQWATKAGVTFDIENACGKRVAVQQGTVQADDDLPARQKKCKDTGKPAIVVDQYQGQDQATLSVVSGKDDAMLADSPVTAYAVNQSKGKLALAGEIYEAAPYGYIIKKGQDAFGKAIVAAVKALIADGTYKSVLEKWGVEAGGITDPAVNPATPS